jgi:hypothetical protein
MPDFDLSVTICSWNTLEDTRMCLQSLEAEGGGQWFEVIVVDNNSEDGSPDMVARQFPWVRLERMSRNLGFTLGHNHALAMRHGRHALLLNSDTVVHPGALRSLLEFAESDPTLGVIGPKLLNEDGSLQYSCRTFPHPAAALFRNTFLGRLFPKNPYTRDYLMRDWDHATVRDVDWVSGAALFARDTLMQKIGFLDPEYFMYCEDVDYCWRANEAGFRVTYFPGSVITHAIGRSTDKAPNRMIGRFHKSMFRFFRVNMLPKSPAWQRPFGLAGAALAIGARAGLFIAKNKIDDMRRRWQR